MGNCELTKKSHMMLQAAKSTATMLHFRSHIRTKCNWVEAVGMLARARRNAEAFESAYALQCSIKSLQQGKHPNEYSLGSQLQTLTYNCSGDTNRTTKLRLLSDVPEPVAASITRLHLQRHCTSRAFRQQGQLLRSDAII